MFYSPVAGISTKLVRISTLVALPKYNRSVIEYVLRRTRRLPRDFAD